MRTLKGKKSTWLDVLSPNEEDLKKIKKLGKFHPIILKELLTPSAHTRIDQYPDYLFLVVHIPVFDEETRTSRKAEIDLLITKNLVITVHYEALEQIDTFFSELAKSSEMSKELLDVESFSLVHAFFERVIHFSIRQLRHIEEKLTLVTQDVFSKHGDEFLKSIFIIKMDILDYHLIVHPQKELFKDLTSIGSDFWGEKSRAYLRDLQSENQPIHSNLESFLKIIESLETTNAQLVNTETNIIIRKFTVGAFLFSFSFFFIFIQSVPFIARLTLASAWHFWISFIVVHLFIVVLAFSLKKRKIFK